MEEEKKILKGMERVKQIFLIVGYYQRERKFDKLEDKNQLLKVENSQTQRENMRNKRECSMFIKQTKKEVPQKKKRKKKESFFYNKINKGMITEVEIESITKELKDINDRIEVLAEQKTKLDQQWKTIMKKKLSNEQRHYNHSLQTKVSPELLENLRKKRLANPSQSKNDGRFCHYSLGFKNFIVRLTETYTRNSISNQLGVLYTNIYRWEQEKLRGDLPDDNTYVPSKDELMLIEGMERQYQLPTKKPSTNTATDPTIFDNKLKELFNKTANKSRSEGSTNSFENNCQEMTSEDEIHLQNKNSQTNAENQSSGSQKEEKFITEDKDKRKIIKVVKSSKLLTKINKPNQDSNISNELSQLQSNQGQNDINSKQDKINQGIDGGRDGECNKRYKKEGGAFQSMEEQQEQEEEENTIQLKKKCGNESHKSNGSELQNNSSLELEDETQQFQSLQETEDEQLHLSPQLQQLKIFEQQLLKSIKQISVETPTRTEVLKMAHIIKEDLGINSELLNLSKLWVTQFFRKYKIDISKQPS